MNESNYVALSLEIEHSDSASARCSVGAVAVYLAVVVSDSILVT